MSDISVKGIILNLLSIGFSTIAGICEFIDNSYGAKATVVNLQLKGNMLTYWDNGKGMNKKQLKEAHIIANRSETVSTTTQGRYGMGRKCAMFCFTQLKSSTLTVSKTNPSSEDSGFNQLIIELPTVIREDKYINIASGITYEDKHIWDEAAGDLATGTLDHFECDATIAFEIREKIEIKKIPKSYLYWFGVAYCNDLKNGFKIVLNSNGKIYEVIPIDPLEWDFVPESNKKETHMEVWRNGNNIVLLQQDGVDGFYETYKNNAGKNCTRFCPLDLINSIREQTAQGVEKNAQKINGKKISMNSYPVNSGFSKEHYKKTGNITKRSVYQSDTEWTNMQSYVYEHIGEPMLSSKNQEDDVSEDDDASVSTYIAGKNTKQRKNQETFTFMGGEYFTRNGRRIKRFNIKPPKSGNKDRYPFQTNSRHEFIFTAEMDEEMGIHINKSELKRELISPQILPILEELEKQFVDEQYKLHSKPLVKQPDIKQPDIKQPDIKQPDIKQPDIKQPDIKEPTVNRQSVINQLANVQPVISQRISQPVANTKRIVLDDSDEDDEPSTGNSISENVKVVYTPVKKDTLEQNDTNTKEESKDDESKEEESKDDESKEDETEDEPIRQPANIITPIPKPTVKQVGPKTDITFTINKGKEILRTWSEKKDKISELSSTLDKMIIKYLDRSSQDQIELMLSYINVKQKYDIICKCIKNKYPNEVNYDTHTILYGADLWRSYNEAFPQTL